MDGGSTGVAQVMAYGRDRADAVHAAQVLAFRVIADPPTAWSDSAAPTGTGLKARSLN